MTQAYNSQPIFEIKNYSQVLSNESLNDISPLKNSNPDNDKEDVINTNKEPIVIVSS